MNLSEAASEVARLRRDHAGGAVSASRSQHPGAPVLDDDRLYLGDNGRCLCGACSGASARYTGFDLSGAPVEPVTTIDVLAVASAYGVALRCESCGKETP